MKKLSANRIFIGGECGGVAFSKSGDEMPCLHPFKVAVNFFDRRQLPSTIFRTRPGHNENNFRMFGDVEARITNIINVILRFWRKVSSPSFCAMLAQSRPQILPCSCRMKEIPADRFLTGGENRANHCQNPGAGFVASVASGSRRIFCKVCRGHPSCSARVLAVPKIISIRPAARESEKLTLKVFGEFHFDQGLIFAVVGFGPNGAIKGFDADGETSRWFSWRSSAASFWLIAFATAKIKVFVKVVWRISSDKSCAQSAQDDFKTLITLLRMVNLIAHKYRPEARGRFTGHQPQTYFAAVKAGFRRCEIRGRNGRKLPNAFCVLDTSLPVCLRAGSQLGGRINGPDEKALCSNMETSHLKNR